MSRLTLKSEVSFSGVGLHSGKTAFIRLLPAHSGDGYIFDFSGERFPVELASHAGDGRGTILNFGNHKVMTVEHLLGALRGLEIDDVIICPESVETPLLDGSAKDFCSGILNAGIVTTSGEPSCIKISSPIYAVSEDENKLCAVFPSDRLRFTYSVEYGDNAIGTQMATVMPNARSFVSDLGQCRTFCLYEEVEQMRAMGLGLGGTVETALIVRGHEILTPGGLRRSDEFVRHKILDMVGDLALLGKKVVGHFVAVRAGHAMHQKLVDLIARQYC